MEQPTPDVSEADVARVLRRDFEPAEARQVEARLRAADPPLSPRIALAVLKLSEGRLASFLEHLEVARRDWRDVIAYAEYPAYMREVPPGGSVSPEQRDAIIRGDWEQYQAWLGR